MEARILRNATRLLHAFLIVVVIGATLAVAAAIEVVDAPPAYACRQCPSAPVQPTDSGFLSTVRAGVNELNRYSESNPTPCVGIDDFTPADDPRAQKEGYLRWREPALGQDGWRGVDDNGEPGHYWRLECYSPESNGPFGRLIDVRFFPQITAENLARLAVAEALTTVSAPVPRFEPGFDSQLVNFETWIYIDGIEALAFPGPTISVPGMSVSVMVSSGGVYLDMGDGSGFGCDLASDPNVPDCTYTYTRSSAHQADLRFHGTASIRWTASYQVNGGPVQQVADAVVEQATFSTRVAEGQAIVTGG